jgi:hypothetical protein
MSVKIEAYDYDGRIFRTENDVLDYQAQEAVQAEYTSNGGDPQDIKKLMRNPRRVYNILRSIYGDS